MYYLYRITNILNNKTYIGQSVNPGRRWKDHQWLSKNTQEQYIHRAIAKYGVINFIFEVIATSKTQEDANLLEAQLIIQYNSLNSDFGYNLKPGGMTCEHSEETKKKISDALNNRSAEEKIETVIKIKATKSGWTEEYKNDINKKISAALTGIPHTEERKKHNSVSHLGLPVWNKDTKGIMKPNITSFRAGQQSWSKGTKGLTRNQSKLTKENIFEIIFNNNKLSKQELADKFNITERAIRDIWAGRTWNHITKIKTSLF